MMERRYGRIINVTSTAGLLGTIGQVNYSAAKAGIVGLTLVRREGIGAIRHHRERDRAGRRDANDRDDSHRRALQRQVPGAHSARPLGRAAEIAPVFVFFASDAASYVTGQVLAADGGMTIR